MTLKELPQKIQDLLENDRDNWKGKIASDSYSVIAYNRAGNRFFTARRRCIGWQDKNNGNSMPFGGGSYWEIHYGKMQWYDKSRRDPLGGRYTEYGWAKGLCFSKVTNTDTDETIDIPKELGTKKEVMDLLKKLEFKGFADLKNEPIESPKSFNVYDKK